MPGYSDLGLRLRQEVRQKKEGSPEYDEALWKSVSHGLWKAC